jgi:hypothetical protein
MGNSTIRSDNLFREPEGMGLLSFFGSAQVNFKMSRRKTFSTATTEMRMTSIASARSAFVTKRENGFRRMDLAIEFKRTNVRGHKVAKQHIRGTVAVAIPDHYQPFRYDSRSFLFRRDAGF